MNRNPAKFVPTSATSQFTHFRAGTSTWLAISSLVVSGLMSNQLFAQTTTPGTYADANSPSGAPDPLKLDSIWQIDNISGSLSLKIPFGTVPTGGRGPKIPFSLSYNSSATVTLQTSGPVQNGQIEPFQWAPGNISSTYPSSPIGPWAMSGPTITGSYTQIPDYTPIYGNGIYGQTQYGCTILGPYLYNDENGAIHDLNVGSGGSSSQNAAPACSDAYNAQVLQGATVDGSNLQTTPGTAIYPNGTAYTGPGTLEDSNGNIASITQDSEGRTPFTTTLTYNQNSQLANSLYELAVGTYPVTTKGAGGNTESYSVTVAAVSIGGYTMPHPSGGSDFCCLGTTQTGVNTQGSIVPMNSALTVNAITSIGLPNGTAYTFTYDPTYGNISKITFPTGGYVRFIYGIRSDAGGYGFFLHKSSVVVTDAYVSTGSGAESHWLYTFNSMTTPGILTSTVTAPDASYTNYTGSAFIYSSLNLSFGSAPSFRETSRSTYSSSGSLVQSVATTYNAPGVLLGTNFISGLGAYYAYPPYPSQVATTLYDGPSPIQSQVQFVYDKYNNVVEKDESDYYGCSGSPCAPTATPTNGWLRKTFTNYLWSNPNSGQPTFGKTYNQAYIVDKPSQVTVTDGSGNVYSQAQYNYDEFPLSGSAGILQHDDTNFPASMVGPRGNLTTEKHCSVISGTSCSTWLSKTTKYDLTGMPVAVSDYNTNVTTYNYTDAYLSGTPSKPTNAYPTTVTTVTGAAIPHIDTYTYNYLTGSVASHTDPNHNTTTFAYADPLNRMTSTVYPPTVDGTSGTTANGGVSYTFTDSATSGWSVVKNVKESSAGSQISSTVYYDGLGRTSTTKLTSDPAGTDIVLQAYDGMGRVYSKTNPYRSTGDSTYGVTTFTYDALGRKRIQTNPDLSTVTLQYGGQTVDSWDEAGVHMQHTSDALGRLTKVMELGTTASQFSLTTLYTYDSLGNLKTVNQQGKTGDPAHNRSFVYDPLSRLTQSVNPETGTISYSYRNGTQLCSGEPSLPCLKTDNRGRTTTYAYDQWNRLTNKFYSDGTRPASFEYDGLSSFGLPSYNSVGRLTTVTDHAVTATGYSYDAVGRINLQNTYLGGFSGNSVSAAYDLAGNMTDLTYPDGRHVRQCFDSAGRLSSSGLYSGGPCPTQNYVQSISYLPDGSPHVLTLGNGVQQTITENNLQQIQSMSVSNPLLPFSGEQFSSRTYNHVNPASPGAGNNGNIFGIVDALNGSRSQAFTYDSLNRIRTFSLGGVLNQQFQIDSFGNMTQVLGVQYLACFDPLTNRMNSGCTQTPVGTPSNPPPPALGYDAAGNLTTDTDSNGAPRTFAYDAESRIASLATTGYPASETYTYGVDGARVRKSNADGTFTAYVDFGGQPIAEVDQSGAWTDYIYANGKKIARVSTADTRLHLSGNNCASCGWPYRWFWFPPVPQGLAFQPGTKLAWRQYQSGAASPTGGIFMITNTGQYLNWGVTDQNGQSMNSMTTQGQWVQRVVDLSAFNGQWPVQIGLGADGATGTGNWNIYMADIAFVQPDGTVVPLYNGQAAGGWGQWGDPSVQGQTMASETVPLSSDPTSAGAVNAHFYLGDHLGTAQLELASGGWPVWQGQFAPFGGELHNGVPVVADQPDSTTANHYKFTGKERDTESGLDYFGARYYASSMGRWMSPDWADKPEAVPYSDLANPQSLNLYGYVNNNPLTKADPDGHCPWCPVVEQGLSEAAESPAGQAAERAAGQAFSFLGAAITVGLAKASGVLDTIANSIPDAAPGGNGSVCMCPIENRGAAPAKADSANTGPKAAKSAGVTAGGQATDEHGNKLGPSRKPQVNKTQSSSRKGADDKAKSEGSGSVEHSNPKVGKPHFHPTDADGNKKPTSTHHEYPDK